MAPVLGHEVVLIGEERRLTKAALRAVERDRTFPWPLWGRSAALRLNLGPFWACCCHTSPCCIEYNHMALSLPHYWPSCGLKSKRYGAASVTRSDVFLESLEANTRIVSTGGRLSAICSCVWHQALRPPLLSIDGGSTAGPLMAARHGALFSRYLRSCAV